MTKKKIPQTIEECNAELERTQKLLQQYENRNKMLNRKLSVEKRKERKGAMTGIVYRNAPQNVFHSWVEVYFENRWYELEALILDMGYLKKLQAKYSECTGAFCGFGVAVKDFKNPVIDFDRNNTYIQSEGINQDFGVYDSPDELLKEHHQEMSRVKAFLYRNWGRHMMNRNVRKIRGK